MANLFWEAKKRSCISKLKSQASTATPRPSLKSSPGHPPANFFLSVWSILLLVVGAQGVAFYSVLGAPFVGHLAADFP